MKGWCMFQNKENSSCYLFKPQKEKCLFASIGNWFSKGVFVDKD